MLALVLLMRLHDAHRRETRVIEGAMVPAAPEAVEPVDHHRVQVRKVEIRDPVDVPRDLP